MQAASRTPNSILRKRPNKENDDAAAKAAKRNKLANRRVSFAPDDELETKHIFKEDARDRNSTGELRMPSPMDPCGISAAPGLVDSQPTAQLYNMQQPGEPLAVLPSPGGLSPLSMDLTNNSFEQGHMAAAMAQAAGTQGGLAGALLPSQQQQQQQQYHQQYHHHADYTRNITMNVPNLSTLVEEDEEEYAAADGVSGPGTDAAASLTPPGLGVGTRAGGGGGGHHITALSPISPFVLREMQRGAGGGEDDEVRNRWGFTPGADDTLEVSYGRAVMGEQTYNHVYGGATTGDLTKAIKDGHTGGQHYGQQGAVTRALAAITAARGSAAAAAANSPTRAGASQADPAGAAAAAGAARDATFRGLDPGMGPSTSGAAAGGAPQMLRQMSSQRPEQLQAQAPAAQAHHVTQPFQVPVTHAPAPLPHNTPFLDNTTKLLEDDQTDAWRLPGHGNNYDRGRLSVASNKVLAPGYRRGGPPGGGGGAGGETTMLLGPTTQLLATGGNTHTAQLLAETTNHRAAYERFMRNMPGRADAQPSAVPAARAGARAGMVDATAVSSSAAELQRLAAQDSANMSMELGVSPLLAGEQPGSGNNTDLLADAAGLSLDAFALPPEPTVNLSQQQQNANYHAQMQAQMQAFGQWQAQGKRGDGAYGGGQADGQQLMRAPALPAPARPAAPKISCQEFLSLIDVSFNDKVCRTSYLPQSDPPPKTVAEVYEAVAVVAPHVTTYQAMMVEVSGRLSNMQSRVQQLEAEMGASNPTLFEAVQTVPAAQLESIKEQFISLKKLCRIRTVKAIKQTHLHALDDLLSQLESSKAKLQGELVAMTGDVERFNKCTQDKVQLTAAIARRCQEDDSQLQDAIKRKKVSEGHLQRLEALRAQNAQRRLRMEEARAGRQAVEQNRAPKEVLEQERSMLEARISALSVRSAGASALTPGREGQMVKQVAAKREDVEALLGLHAIKMDLAGMENTGSFSMVFRGAYRVACTAVDGTCRIKVERQVGASKPSGLAPSVEAMLGSSAAELSCDIPRAQLPLRLEAITRQLHRLWRMAQQLESCWLKHNCMQKPVVEEAGRCAEGSSGGGVSGPTLLLQFLNADSVTKVAIRMPWEGALRSDAIAPQLCLQMHSLEPAETQHQCCEALNASVLSTVPPSAGYLAALCIAMSVTLQVPSGGGGGGAEPGGRGGSSAAVAEAGAAGTPLGSQQPSGSGSDAGRVFDNPLFTFAAS